MLNSWLVLGDGSSVAGCRACCASWVEFPLLYFVCYPACMYGGVSGFVWVFEWSNQLMVIVYFSSCILLPCGWCGCLFEGESI